MYGFIAAEAKRQLIDAGFNLLNENDDWELKPGGRYFFTRNMSCLVAFAVGEKLVPEIVLSFFFWPREKKLFLCEALSNKIVFLKVFISKAQFGSVVLDRYLLRTRFQMLLQTVLSYRMSLGAFTSY